jgi:hypothetical protein
MGQTQVPASDPISRFRTLVGSGKDTTHPVLVGAIREIRDSCRRNNVVPAIHAMNGAMARTFLADGFRMVTAVSDLTALRTGLARELSAARAGHYAATTSCADEQQCPGPGPHMRRLEDGTP